MPQYNFHFGKKAPTLKQWVIYSVGAAVTVSMMVQFGNKLLQSKHGEFARDVVCSVSKILPDGYWARLMFTLCDSSKDGKITETEAKTLLGRAQQVTGLGGVYFDNDRQNTNLRAQDEVDFAIERWKLANPSPKIDDTLRKQLPLLTETQLCVLSQAERYTDGDAIGIRYVGMGVCKEW